MAQKKIGHFFKVASVDQDQTNELDSSGTGRITG
jgi:hypothetical protein